MHLQVGKAVDDIQRYNVAIVSVDGLGKASFERTVVNFVLATFNLHRRVNGGAHTVVGAAMHDTYDRSALRYGLGCGVNQREFGKFVVVYPSDVETLYVLNQNYRVIS